MNPNTDTGISPLETLRRLREQAATQDNESGPAPLRNVEPDLISSQSGEIAKPSGSKWDVISKIQLYLLLGTLLILPAFILPLPWGWVEFSKGSLLIIVTILLATLEVMKVLLTGRFSMLKGFADISALLILVSFLLSTIFSRDLDTSLFGFDHRIGTGFIAISSIFVLFSVVKSFVKDESNLKKMLMAFSIGISLSALLSILSFFGVNVLGLFKSMNDLFIPGFSLLASSSVALVAWGVGLFVKMLLLSLYSDKSQGLSVMVLILALIDIVGFGLFSITEGLQISILFIIAMLAAVAVVWKYKSNIAGNAHIWITSIVAVFVLFIGVMAIPGVRNAVGESTNASGQVMLSNQLTWSIVTSTLSESVGTGILGLGVDTFSIYFNIYKPAFGGDIDLTETNFTYGSNEILTTMGNRGVLGAIIWLVIGVLLVYQVIRVFGNKDLPESSITKLLLLDIALLVLYASSFLVYYGFILYFVFMMLLAIRVMLSAVLSPSTAESFVMKLDLLVERVGQRKSDWLPIGLSAVAILLGVFLLSTPVGKVNAVFKVLRAEDRILEVRDEITQADADREEGQPSAYPFDKREEALVEIADLYAEAIALDPDNSQLYRRRVMILMDYMTLLLEDVSRLSAELEEEGADEDEIAEDAGLRNIQGRLNRVIEVSIEQADKAVELGPNTLANWDVRAFMFSQLVSLNLPGYADAGLVSVDNALRLNPSSYLQYYRATELFIAKEDLESAGGAVTRALNINPNHIPSLLLASEISIAGDNYEVSVSLLQRVLEILKAIEAEDSEIYTFVENRLDQLEEAIETGVKLPEVLDPNALPGEGDDPLSGDVNLDDVELPDGPVDTGVEIDDEE